MYRKTSFLVMVFTLMVGLFPLTILAAPPLQEQEGGQTYTVQRDDCLWKIAEKYLGNGAAYPTIVDATNRKAAEDDTFATIVNPGLIYLGWKLWIPSVGIFVVPPVPCDIEGDTSKIVTCEFEEEGVTGPVSFEPIPVTNDQPLQLEVVGTELQRTHFGLEIEIEDYPPPSFGDAFTLTVTAIPSETIAADFEACQEESEECEYPEVEGLTRDGRLIILVDSGKYAGEKYVAANPYAFSVTGIVTFTNPVKVSISVDIPTDEITKPHGIIIHHEDDGTTERFPATQLITQNVESGFYLVTNSDSITRCCAANGHCSSGPTCLE
jgi:hypothetical protein